MTHNGWRILFLATCFWLLETRYFGWNWTPQSPQEVICDGIVFVIAAMALLAR